LAKWPIFEIVIILLSIMALVAIVRLWKKKLSGNATTADMVTQVPKEMLHELSEIPEAWTKIVKSIQNEYGNESIEELEKAAREQRLKNIGIDTSIPLSELAKEDIEDEEMIRQFLLRSGGQAYQSDIVNQSGLSKSKISMVLSKMKDDGMIIKIRKGKENLIRLVPEINEK
jgi:DNA-binding transcriptional ArsR family regulator